MSQEISTIVKGKVTGITNFGAFVEIEGGKRGMVHISEISRSYVEDISKVLSVGQAVECKILSIADDGKLALSIKQAQSLSDKPQGGKCEFNKKPQRKYTPAPKVTSPGDFEWQSSSTAGASFEDMMSRFKKTSEDKMSDLKRGESRGYSRRGNGSGRK
ncbi:MAG: S1 RNA-binding domain-containing protein [Ruminococcaceae bacterium]|nr:S1 RNA-binding domain-containing protein [Oscillospiraceae bacterium]